MKFFLITTPARRQPILFRVDQVFSVEGLSVDCDLWKEGYRSRIHTVDAGELDVEQTVLQVGFLMEKSSEGSYSCPPLGADYPVTWGQMGRFLIGGDDDA